MSDIYLSLTETPSVVTLSQPVISGALSSTVTVANTVTVALDANSLSALENVTVTVGAAVSVSNFPASQVVTGSVAVTTMPALSISSVTISNFPTTQVVSVSNLPASQTISGTVTVGNSVTIGSLPSISGTVTATVRQGEDAIIHDPVSGYTFVRAQSHWFSDSYGESKQTSDSNPLPISGTVTVGNTVTIAGTVTANPTGTQTIEGTVTVGGFSTVSVGGTIGGLLISGRRSGAAENIVLDSGTGYLQAIPQVPNGMGGYVNVSDELRLPVKGSVTVGAMPSGALTTRFGSVTTANTAQLTSAVTNSSRKFLLVQNIATSTVTIGIGFAPTTTQGIQLTAGAGLTFDAFCPTGGVWWLSSSAGSNFSILEG